MGGGGTSGKVDWPSHLKNLQTRFAIGLEYKNDEDWHGLGSPRVADQAPYHLSQAMTDVMEHNPFHLADVEVPVEVDCVSSATAQIGGSSSTINLASSSSTTDDYYNDMYIYIMSGTGAGQTRIISDYDYTDASPDTFIATVSEDWDVIPDATSVYRIYSLTTETVAGNPNAVAYDPDTRIAAIDAALTRLQNQIIAVSPETDWARITGQAKLDANSLFQYSPIETNIQDQITKALSDAKKLVQTASESSIDIDSAVDSTLEKVTKKLAPFFSNQVAQADALFRPIISKTLTQAATDMDSSVLKSVATAQKYIQPILDTNIGKTSQLDKTINDAVSRASTKIGQLPAEALNIAKEAIATDIIDDLVLSFERRERKSVNRELGRYKASMAATGTILSSAFAGGLALILDAHQDRISEFRAKLTAEAFQDVFRSYLERHAQHTALEVNSKIQVAAMHLQVLASSIADQLRLYSNLLAEQGEPLLRMIADQYRFHSEHLVNILNHKVSGMQTTIQAAQGYTAPRIGSFMQSYLEDRGMRNRYIQAVPSTVAQWIQQKLQAETQLVHYSGEMNRLAIAAKAQEQETNLEIDVRELQFPLDTYDYANRMLAAISGSAPMPQSKSPNKAASILGGAISGAGGGAAIAEAASLAAGPAGWAIGIGAAIGGLAGALG